MFSITPHFQLLGYSYMLYIFHTIRVSNVSVELLTAFLYYRTLSRILQLIEIKYNLKD